MKKFAIIAFIILSTVAAYAQAIPPYSGGDKSMPDSIPSVPNKNKDLPAQAGCYMVEGGVSGYYSSGKYYKNINDPDSKGKQAAPWGFQVNPTGEFFLFNMFAIGITTSFVYDQNGADNVLSLGVGPIFSFYYNKSYPVIPFFSIFGIYEHQNYYFALTKSMYWTDQNMKGGVKAGVTYMISRQAGVFFDLRFTYEVHYVAVPPVTTQAKRNGWIAETFLGFKYFIF
jgi:hypothetical protein